MSTNDKTMTVEDIRSRYLGVYLGAYRGVGKVKERATCLNEVCAAAKAGGFHNWHKFIEGVLAMRLYKMEDALKLFDEVLASDPTFAMAWNNNCLLYTSPSPRD